jgi:nucleoside-diphosphate-sugar epimerase
MSVTTNQTKKGTVLVTGAGGFVGRHAVPILEAAGWAVRGVGRAETGELDGDLDWRPFLDGADAVLHLAARVHVMAENEDDPDPAARYAKANRDATLRLGEQAHEAGVTRFVFMSTVKVHGERSETPLSGASPTAPIEPYAVAKLEAENGLTAIAGDMALTVLRPPLVYGPEVRGNFLKLIEAVERGVPLPLGAVHNRRSLVYVGNLAESVVAALAGPPGTYLPADAAPVSTAELVRKLAAALDRPARLISVPPSLLRLAGRVTGKSAAIQRLVDSLVVDGKVPGWTPRTSFEDGLAAVAAWRRRMSTG